MLPTVVTSTLNTGNCYSTGSLQTKYLLVLSVEENGYKLSAEVIGTHGLQKEYQKSVTATCSQVGNNSFSSVRIKKINGVSETD